MTEGSRVRVYMASSLDGFIAGPDNELGWLERDHSAPGDLPADPQALGFAAFMAEVGSMLMGRTTYDTVEGLGQWIYGETPVLVATRRPLQPVASTVQAVAGDIAELIAQAKALAAGKDVYLDGGALIRQALDAGLVDELTISYVPILLGAGIRLFDGLASSSSLQFTSHRAMEGGMLQVRAQVRPRAR